MIKQNNNRLANLLAIIFLLFLVSVSCSKNEIEEEQIIPKSIIPIFSISPKEKDFGIIENNTTQHQEFIITNSEKSMLKLINFSFEGINKGSFNTDAKNNRTIAKGEKYTFKVTFKPTSEGNKTAMLKITYNGGSNSVVLKGVSLSKESLKKEEDAWLFFKDKPKASIFLANPSQMLSVRAIERRNKQGIALDIKDVPIEKTYYDKVKSTFGVTVLAKSKWLNAVHIQAPQSTIEILKKESNFISKVEYADKSLNKKAREFSFSSRKAPRNKFERVTADFVYGNTKAQVEMLKTNVLHKKGFTGKGVVIAVIDGGFPNVNTIAPFKRIRDNNQILGGYDFVKRSPNFYTGNRHGTHVLSTIAGYIKSKKTNFVGTAPDASFYLFRTENTDKEEVLEESLWVEAAEKADSLGVDVINTSLGYSIFDNTKHNHTYADLDGKTTFISRGAEISASRGIIVINSAGNEGNKTWKYLRAPADAKSVLTVGAVTRAKGVANFSSRGPTADGRTKPDVMALGFLAIITNYETGYPSITNGTSFSSPIMAGAIACLRQAYPNKKASEIIEQVKKGGDKYISPDNNHGYGIPNFEQIFENMKN